MIENSSQEEHELQARLVTASKEPSQPKGTPLSNNLQRIMHLIVILFAPEMHRFATRLSKGRYDPADAIQDAHLAIIESASSKFETYDPTKIASAPAWLRKVYRRAIIDSHRKHMRYVSRHASLDGHWSESEDEND